MLMKYIKVGINKNQYKINTCGDLKFKKLVIKLTKNSIQLTKN